MNDNNNVNSGLFPDYKNNSKNNTQQSPVPSPTSLLPQPGQKKSYKKILIWLLIILIVLGVAAVLISRTNLNPVDGDMKAALKTDYYVKPPQDWNTYINKQYGLSMRYPSNLTLQETPWAWGEDDIFSIELKDDSDQLAPEISIFATTNSSKCSELASKSYIPMSDYTDKKIINGKTFKVVAGNLLTTQGAPSIRGYLLEQPICRIAILAYINSDKKGDSESKAKINSALSNIENIIGTFDTDIESQNDNTGKVTYIYEGSLAFQLDYFHKTAPTIIKNNSYSGVCNVIPLAGGVDIDLMLAHEKMTCKDSKTSYVYYVKSPERNQYLCSDIKHNIVVIPKEPTGLSCM